MSGEQVVSSGATRFRYKAFISYSHVDKAWGDWLHKALESYRVPAQLANAPGRDGPVPAKLFPIFRDREELPSSADLGEQVNKALQDAAILIVICSPNAAASRWVNEEILAFKRLGRTNRILALIVSGEPNAADKPQFDAKLECFPPALKFHLGPDGELSAARVEPIAADARPHADGKENAKLKLIAGILGVGFDSLKQRELEAARLRTRIAQTIAGGFAVLAVAALAATYFAWQNGIEAARQRDIALTREAHFLSDQANQALEAGDPQRATLIALEALPIKGRDPETPEARKALAAAYAAGMEERGAVLLADRALAFSSDGKRIATAAYDKAQIWDTGTGARLGPALKSENEITFAVFSPDGSRLVTATDNRVRIWDTTTGAAVGQPITRNKPYESNAFEPEGASVAAIFEIGANRFLVPQRDGSVQRWDASSGEVVDAPVPHSGSGTFAGFSVDGRRLVTSTRESVQLWDSAANAPLCPPIAHDRAVHGVVFSPGGTRVLTVGWEPVGMIGQANTTTANGVARLFDAATCAPVGSPLLHDQTIVSAGFSPSSKMIVTGSSDGTIRIWDAVTTTQLSVMAAPRGLSSVAFTPDGSSVVAVASDTLQLWDVAMGELRNSRVKANRAIARVMLDNDGAIVAFETKDSPHGFSYDAVELWNIKARAPLGQVIPLSSDNGTVAFSPNDKQFVAITQGRATLWDSATRTSIGAFIGRENGVNAVAFSPDGSRIAAAANDGTVQVLNAASGAPLFAFSHGAKPLRSVAFSPDGRRLLTASEDFTARLWNAADGNPLGSPMKHDDLVRSAIFSADGARIATASADASAKLWDGLTAAPIGAAMKHPDFVHSVSFTPDGRHLATTTADAWIRLWDSSSGALLGPMMKHDASIFSASFSPDGARLLTLSGGPMPVGLVKHGNTERGVSVIGWDDANGGRTAILWDAATRMPIARLSARIMKASFSRDGARVVTASMDRSVRLWDAATGAELGRPIHLESAALSADISADGTRLVVLSRDYARLLDAGPPLPAMPEREAVAYLTSSEHLDDKTRRQLYLAPAASEALPRTGSCLSPMVSFETRDRLFQLAPDFPYKLRIGSPIDMSTVAEAVVKACKSELAARPKEAPLWFELGHALAFLDQTPQAIEAFMHARDAGSTMASLELGNLYAGGKAADKAEASYERAFSEGVTEAYAALAQLSWDGGLVARDHARSLRLWRAAADKGDPYALQRLADLEESGRDPLVPRNLQDALFHWALAVERSEVAPAGDSYALSRRASLARYFAAEKRFDVIAKVWAKVAAFQTDHPQN
jgi:WD40 repeat protein/TPR repeat protein